MPTIPERSKEWYVNIPFSDLNLLINQLENMEAIQNDNAQLRREMDGMRNMFNELLTAFGELRRELKGRLAPSHLLLFGVSRKADTGGATTT